MVFSYFHCCIRLSSEHGHSVKTLNIYERIAALIIVNSFALTALLIWLSAYIPRRKTSTTRIAALLLLDFSLESCFFIFWHYWVTEAVMRLFTSICFITHVDYQTKPQLYLRNISGYPPIDRRNVFVDSCCKN